MTGILSIKQLMACMQCLQSVKRAFIELFFIWLVLLFVAHPALAHTAGSRLRVNPAGVHPTQSMIGYLWVGKKYEKFADMDEDDLVRQLKDDPAPAVLGPGGIIYVLDNHHEFYALVELHVTEAYVQVIEDFSHLSQASFDKRMIEREWYYFGDENGNMTFTPATMVSHVAQMRDDPYRSLASFARKAGAFEKDNRPHSEFEWANDFRKVITLRLVQEDFDEALRQAIDYAEQKSCEKSLKSKKKP